MPKSRSRSRSKRYGPKAAKKVEAAMRERKRGTWHSGRAGAKVPAKPRKRRA